MNLTAHDIHKLYFFSTVFFIPVQPFKDIPDKQAFGGFTQLPESEITLPDRIQKWDFPAESLSLTTFQALCSVTGRQRVL